MTMKRQKSGLFNKKIKELLDINQWGNVEIVGRDLDVEIVVRDLY